MIETDFLRDTDGHGWRIDRTRFDVWLRGVAVTRGALLAMPARLDAVERDDAYWHVRLAGTNGLLNLRAAVLIDCGGRAAPVARCLAARPTRLAMDRLMCSWAVGRARDGVSGAGFSVVEAAEEGWWYTAPMPGQRRVVAFFTDADLPARRSVTSGPALLAQAMATAKIGRLMDEAEFEMLHGGWRPAIQGGLKRVLVRAGSRRVMQVSASIRFPRKGCCMHCSPGLLPRRGRSGGCAAMLMLIVCMGVSSKGFALRIGEI
jgi:flavin-dependent dehydrogenase